MFSARKAENEQRLWAMCTFIDNAHVVMRSGVYETVCPVWPPLICCRGPDGQEISIDCCTASGPAASSNRAAAAVVKCGQ